MSLRICFSVVDSLANVLAPRALPRGPHLGPPPLDITDRDRALRERRELAAKLEAAQQEERRRIVRDIHDELVQLLAGVAIDLGGFAAHPPDSARGTSRQARALQRQVVRAAQMARSISHRLYPSELDDLGLAAALHALCEDFARRENMTVDFVEFGLPTKIPVEIGSCLYKVIQEGLRNAVKHAQARRARVALARKGSVLRLSVKDAGIGFTPSSSKRMAGLGLGSMRERVQVLAGTFSVQSQPDEGTEINVEVSLPKK